MMLTKLKRSKGFSLVELMVAMAVGVLIVGGAFSLHSATRKTQMTNEAQMDMVADARFALEMISYDLRHAGMWGGTNKDGLIDCKSTDAACVSTAGGDTPPGAAANDCATGTSPVWAFNLSTPVFASNAANPYSASCIPDATEKYLAGTDVLEIRYADSNVIPAAKLKAGQTYLRSNFINGRLFIGSKEPVLESYDPDPLTLDHQLHVYAYYISDYTDAVGDGIPSLRRAALANGPAIQNQTLVSGVTDLQVQFGEDVDGNATVDRYVDPDKVTNWKQVYSAKVWLLLRTDKRQMGVDTTKTFTIAGVAATYGGPNEHRYFMVTSVIDLRNLRQL
ncbi:MAG: PilW family protein [Gammaproteobacteria bacterium]|nr:PilW family protein [Gammaproteobacteria bacterium]